MTPLEALEQLRQNCKDGSHLFDDELFDYVERALKNADEAVVVLSKKVTCLNHELEKKTTAINVIKSTRGLIDGKDFCEYDGKCYFFATKISKKKYDILREVLL